MRLTAEDRIEIQELSSKYAVAMDTSNKEMWLGTWADHGVWEGAIGRFEGIENLKLVMEKLGERLKGKRHVMTNFIIEGDSSNASQTCYLLIIDSAKQSPPGIAVYSDKLEKKSGHWKFVSRTVKID